MFPRPVRAALLWAAAFAIPAGAAHAVIRELPKGESPLPPAVGKEKKTAEELLAALERDKDALVAALDGHPIRIVGRVRGFEADYPLNHERDFFVDIGPEKEREDAASSFRLFVRFTRPQLRFFGYPEDRKPVISDSRYQGAERAVNQAHTVAYLNKDLGCIALYSSETLSVGATTAKTKVQVPYVIDKIPLVSPGDPFEADVVLEQLDAAGTLILDATIGSDARH